MKLIDLPEPSKIIINHQVQSIIDAIHPDNDDKALLTNKLNEMMSVKPGLKP